VAAQLFFFFQDVKSGLLPTAIFFSETVVQQSSHELSR